MNVHIELDGADPPQGRVVTGACARTFTGWLSLLQVLEDATTEDPVPPPVHDTEPLDRPSAEVTRLP